MVETLSMVSLLLYVSTLEDFQGKPQHPDGPGVSFEVPQCPLGGVQCPRYLQSISRLSLRDSSTLYHLIFNATFLR
jgi:hypothetical protein